MGYSKRKCAKTYVFSFLIAVIAVSSIMLISSVIKYLIAQVEERRVKNIEAHCLSVSAQDPSITVSEASILKQACIDDLINAEKIINNIQ